MSNMYPSKEDPLFGVFIKNFISSFESLGVNFTKKALIKGKTNSSIKKVFKYFNFYVKIIRFYLSKDYDLIYVHYISHNAPIIALMLFLFGKRKPIVINVHGSDIVKTEKSIFAPFIKYCLKRIDCLVVPSSYFKSVVLELYPFFDSGKIEISPSGGIDFKVFHTKEQKVSPQDVFHFGLVSRIDNNKGWDDFIFALYSLKEKGYRFKASIAGQGKEEFMLIDEIKKRSLEDVVIFKGLINQDKLIDLYNDIDVLVFPTKLKEGLGLVGLEAMACSTPVIASNSSGPATYVNDSVNGFLFETGNVDELSFKMEKIIKLNKKELLKMKINSLNEAEKYESKLVVKNLSDKMKKIKKAFKDAS